LFRRVFAIRGDSIKSQNALGWKRVQDLSQAGVIGKRYEGYGDNSTGTRVENARNWLKRYNDATRDRQSLVTPATPSHTLAVNVNTPKGWQASTIDTGLLAKKHQPPDDRVSAGGWVGAKERARLNAGLQSSELVVYPKSSNAA